jgi:hypothetical protein
MADEGNRIPEATELIYLPAPSWKPVLLAFGLAAMVAGVFMGWVWLLAGAIVSLLALWGWIRDIRSDLSRLPRTQAVTSAVIPATPLRAPRRRPSAD